MQRRATGVCLACLVFGFVEGLAGGISMPATRNANTSSSSYGTSITSLGSAHTLGAIRITTGDRRWVVKTRGVRDFYIVILLSPFLFSSPLSQLPSATDECVKPGATSQGSAVLQSSSPNVTLP